MKEKGGLSDVGLRTGRNPASAPGTNVSSPPKTNVSSSPGTNVFSAAGMVELLQVKTVLMGEVGAGKTSLLNALRSVILRNIFYILCNMFCNERRVFKTDELKTLDSNQIIITFSSSHPFDNPPVIQIKPSHWQI